MNDVVEMYTIVKKAILLSRKGYVILIKSDKDFWVTLYFKVT